MKPAFSKHALGQIQLRGIDIQKVMAILEDPSQRIQEDGLTVFQGLITENGRPMLLRIFVNLLKQPPLVVTVYKTSKIYKYWQ
ncbi:MAG: DUF4258 domain-containing protein [Sphingobacteriaceae bacterium]